MTLSESATRQARLKLFIRRHFREHDRLPTTREAAGYLGVCQTSAILSLQSLADSGWLEKDGRYWRFGR